MDFARAFKYVFEDPKWVDKLGMTALVTLVSGIPILGLAALAVLLGYVLELIANVRAKTQYPLPRWVRWEEKLRYGTNILVAWVLYNLPNILVSCCLFTFSGMFQGNFLGNTLALGALCCTLPLLLIYNLITWPMLAVGMLRYSRNHLSAEFYRFGDLFATVRANTGTVFQWLVFTWLASLVLSLLAVTCIGVVATLALLVPVNGHLLAQLALQIEAQPKRG